MNTSVKLLCPFCYSSDLIIINNDPGHSSFGIMQVTPESVGNKTELKCSFCDHHFTAAQAHVSTDIDKPLAGNYKEEAIAALDPDELYIFNKCMNQDRFAAVKYCTDRYGWPLKEARTYVDNIIEKTGINYKNPLAGSDISEDEVVAIIKNNGKIGAIKFVKTNTNLGLKEAKEYIEMLYLKKDIPYKKEGCFIATACYGDYDAPEVKILRYYRDTVLTRSATGRLFIHIYYTFSPPLAEKISHSDKSKRWIRKYLLMPLVRIIDRN